MLGESRFVPGPIYYKRLAWREFVFETEKVARAQKNGWHGLPLRVAVKRW